MKSKLEGQEAASRESFRGLNSRLEALEKQESSSFSTPSPFRVGKKGSKLDDSGSRSEREADGEFCLDNL